MNILVNGSCFNRGGLHGEEPGWVDLLDKSKYNVDNFSLRGAGCVYTLETTVNILTKKKYDAVIIVWPQLYKTDIKTSNVQTFPNIQKTSYYISRQTELASSLLNFSNVDHTKFEQNWVFNNYPKLDDILYEEWFDFLKHTDYKTMVTSNLLKVYILQQFLKSLNIPFLFYFGKRSVYALKYQREHQLFDESVVDLYNTFINTSKSVKSWNKFYWKSRFLGHETFSKIVQKRLDELLKHRIQ
jgi:hypothetical protein